MVQILDRPERQPTLGEKFGRAFSSASQAAATQIPEMLMQKQAQQGQMQAEEQENEALRRMGVDLSGIRNPDARKAILAEHLKSGGQQREKLQPLHSGLETIKEMRKIGEQGNLGRGSAIKGFFGGETAKNRAQYSQLGKSLISLSSNIPIRNKAEFEALAHDLYDPSLPDEAREGILSAMESIIKRSMGVPEEMEQIEQRTSPENKQKTKRPLSSFGD